jgi:hypothetical protein
MRLVSLWSCAHVRVSWVRAGGVHRDVPANPCAAFNTAAVAWCLARGELGGSCGGAEGVRWLRSSPHSRQALCCMSPYELVSCIYTSLAADH